MQNIPELTVIDNPMLNIVERGMRRIFCVLLFGFFLVSCTRQGSQATGDAVDAATGLGAAKIKLEQVDPKLAAIQCQSLCRAKITQGTDVSAGPCLGNPMPGIPTWVCDVAHNPRQAVDNQPQNQCSAFREGKAKHFVEVDEDCNVIKTY